MKTISAQIGSPSTHLFLNSSSEAMAAATAAVLASIAPQSAFP